MTIRKLITIIRRLLSTAAILLSLLALCVVIYDFGFPQTQASLVKITQGYALILVALWFAVTLQAIIPSDLLPIINPRGRRRRAASSLVYAIFTVVALVVISRHYGWLGRDTFTELATNRWVMMGVLGMAAFTILSRFITQLMGKRTNPAVVIASSFALIIFVGSLLLSLPNSTIRYLSYLDALFISTSAVCVTGLSPVDLSATLSTTGYVVLLLLIQVGGLGIMTLTSFFGLFFAGQTFAGQMAVRELVSSDKMTGLLKFLLRILIVTFTVEAAGALMIYLSMVDVPGMEQGEKVFFAIFHAISAFCNAGFSTLHGNLYDPLIRQVGSVIWIISLLIIFGGIGFPIFSNALSIAGHKIRNLFRRMAGRRVRHEPHLWSLNSYIVVRTTLILVIGGWVILTALEWNHSLAMYGFWDKLAQGFLMAVTPRTAGFSGVDMGAMIPASVFITILLMWVGGAPQSTAGGIKVTTFYLAIRNTISTASFSDRLEVRGRRIPEASLRRALGVIVVSATIIFVATIAITILEPGVPLTSALFEVVSAIGTVGLSLNLTPELGTASKMIVIALMFVGRVGVISIIAIFVRRQQKPRNYAYPEENILIS